MRTVFWEQERSADGGIHITNDHNYVIIVLRNTKILRRTIQNADVLFHDNARPNTTARSRALLEHFNWELFDHPPYSPELAPSDYHLFTYVKKLFRSQRFNNNEELMEGVKTRLS
jgi:transposase